MKTKMGRVKRGLLVTIGGAVVNFGLALLKLFLGIVTNSVAIFFDAVNNFLDVAGNGLGAVGVSLVDKKPTKNYPNGFGRIEYLSTFLISVLTILAGFLFIFYSIERLVYPLPINFGWLYFWLLALTVVIKLGMGFGYYIVNKKDNNDITKALYIDSFMDACITGSTVLCYGLTVVVNTSLDAILGIIIGIAILVSAIKMVKMSFKNLLGYNVDIDLEDIKNMLISEHVFDNIDLIKINDYGKLHREILIKGKFIADEKGCIKEIENTENVKIYIIGN